jgi:cold shock CspA family protein
MMPLRPSCCAFEDAEVGHRVLLVRVCCGEDDLFVHVSNLGAGGATLAEGQTVEFEVGPGRKREEAKTVRSL